jgi:2-oxoglutarate ferredoxin oxidoreductase subunit delta
MSDKEFEVQILKRYCKGCGLCVEACPQDKIFINPQPNKDGRQTADLKGGIHCTGCLRCTTICPDAAIEVYELQQAGSNSDRSQQD